MFLRAVLPTTDSKIVLRFRTDLSSQPTTMFLRVFINFLTVIVYIIISLFTHDFT
jgi:hypothetical protein